MDDLITATKIVWRAGYLGLAAALVWHIASLPAVPPPVF